MSNPVEDLKRNWFYEVAKQEMDEVLPPDVSQWSEREWRVFCVAMWIRGATWQRQNPDA